MADTLIAFLWHFHQPLYRDPGTGRFTMPWVRLHATKGYTDLIALVEDYPEVHFTVNVVPTLVDQLASYATGTADDPALDLVRMPADGLNREQAAHLLRLAFQVNWTTQIHPSRRFRELLEKRGTTLRPGGPSDQMLARFTTQDFRDLQVWNTLAWMGFTLRRQDPAVAAALEKGGHFSEAEKAAVLETQARAVGQVIPRLREAQDRGQLELSTSPYFHPILPLLIDTEFTRRALPQATIPTIPFRAPDDAAAQLRMAVESHTNTFGKAPRGCWPSEGSVCPELVPLLANAGFTWCASDEAVLAHSQDVSDTRPGITQPYTVMADGTRITMVFRDRELSDLIGFSYAANPGGEAARDFLHRAHATAACAPRRPALVPVILDGENPWEYYADGGEAFLCELYGGSRPAGDVRFVTMSEGIALAGEGPTIRGLHSGSWINHDYGIWGNGVAESAAWEALRRTREFLVRSEAEQPDLDADARKRAWQELYAAEGSDWFWWYGSDFNSENDPEFDRLFRLHLAGVYHALGAEPPVDLHGPRLVEADLPGSRRPCVFIAPTIDGRVTDYYEWEGAGRLQVGVGGAIHIERGTVRALYFGFDLTHLYLRVDGALPILNENHSPAELRWNLEGTHVWRIRCPAGTAAPATFTVEAAGAKGAFEPRTRLDTAAIGSIAELAVPWAVLEAEPDTVFGLSLSVFRDGLVTERIPHDGALPLLVPSAQFEADCWIV